ncbi:MAG: hypothetical protein F6K18_14990 [Okeania sp. SIO2C2]|uniref:hypothetical protein n=1 Tax=Okeania sp. SIO2C2 TaxID=2607787 RepID=UPI0013B662D0|nr:hypothetical protein [Okeania sp. SIO2C2]NEP88023.1 hypothetical protein [Okeania sp. SIO2C2]
MTFSKKEEGRRKKEEGRRQKEEGRRKKAEGKERFKGRKFLMINYPDMVLNPQKKDREEEKIILRQV